MGKDEKKEVTREDATERITRIMGMNRKARRQIAKDTKTKMLPGLQVPYNIGRNEKKRLKKAGKSIRNTQVSESV